MHRIVEKRKKELARELEDKNKEIDGHDNEMASLKRKLMITNMTYRCKKSRKKGFQTNIKDYLHRDKMKSSIHSFSTNEVGVSRHNLTSNDWHKLNDKATHSMFGFASFQEMLNHTSAFFTDVKIEHPAMSIENGKPELIPKNLTYFGGLLITKNFMHSVAHRSKCSFQFSVSRQSITHQLGKWLPMWAKSGEHLSMLPMPHDCYAKELPPFYSDNNLNKVTHFYDGKDTAIETVRGDDSMRRRIRSEKCMIRPADILILARQWAYRLSTQGQ